MMSISPPSGSFLKCYVCVSNESRIWKEIVQCFPKSSYEVERNLQNLQNALEKSQVRAKVICRGCNMQRYCSVSHLIQDRPEHQALCQVLRDLQKFRKIDHPLLLHGKISSRTKLQFVISQLKLILWVKLGRPLTPREHQLIGDPAVCDVCFSTGALVDCDGCAGVAFCSAGHRQLVSLYHSSKDCKTLAVIASPFRQLDVLVNIQQFFQSCPIKESHLTTAFSKATNIKLSNTPWTDLESYQLFATCSSFSGIGSLCLALTQISWVPDPDKAVIVYIVGATQETLIYFQDMHLNFLFLQFPNIHHLELHFMGKTLGQMGETGLVFSERTVKKHFYPLSFSQFSCICNVDPTLILILQPDFIGTGNITQDLVNLVQKNDPPDFDWHDCLSSIIRTFGVPICYTSISRLKAMSDLTAINEIARENNIDVKRAYNISENPYREIVPLHNPDPLDLERIVYANNYLEVVFTSIKH
ncbi:uncharacterized protein LOC119549486 [Drosophila subpulchrella]|uniref:uncharacterized protein LOC119549486 n=1 Tax=Drosophila subpulchrella TaxID=1486046 RepID=UPI0018A1A8A6|nr:uncharacterized protein LOC119549486 [Drosophila subpulchrella]